jgi:hypothetical protein
MPTIDQGTSRKKPDASGGRFTSRCGSSDVSQAEHCRRHRFDEETFTHWLKHLAGEDAARKFVKYRAELRREKRRKEREKGPKRHQRRGVSVNTDVRNRGTQAFWAMPVEAMN